MRAVIQRVTESHVSVEDKEVGRIGHGLMILLGVEEGDTSADAVYMADKVMNLRIFEDSEEKMNLSVQDVGGALLVVSQFTLMGDARKGRRPSFSSAARPEAANGLYEEFVAHCRAQGMKVETGQFQQHMVVRIDNDGPVTLLLDSKKQF